MTQLELLDPPPKIHQPLKLVLMMDSERTEAMQLWRAIEARHDSPPLMSSSIWTETWLNHFGRFVPYRFAVAMRGGRCCGIGLLASGVDQRNGPFSSRTWHLGTAGEPVADSVCVEYNHLLVSDEDRFEFQLAIWKWLQSESDWDEFRLDGFPMADVNEWISQDANWSVVLKPSRYIALDRARETKANVLSLFGTHTRTSVKRNLRRAGNLRIEWSETVSEAQAIFQELIELHQRRWNLAGHPGCYASRVFREFHEELLTRLVPTEQMILFRVRNEQGTLGCNQVLIDQNRACIYQCGRFLPPDHRISTGVVVDYTLMDECLKRGYDAVDFLAGNSPHKCRMSTDEVPLAWAIYRRRTLKNQFVDSMRSVKRVFLQTLARANLSRRSAEGQRSGSEEKLS